MARDREKARAYMKQYNQRNREKNLRYEKERYLADPEKFKAKGRAYRKANPEKVAAAVKAWRERNKERVAIQKRLKPRDPGRMRDSRLRRMYKLTPQLFDQLLTVQGGCCAICKRSFIDYEPHIDHEHGGDVRGILCMNCNSALGHFRDNPALMVAAMQYLEEPPARGLLTPQLALFEAAIYAAIPESTRAKATASINRFLVAG